MIKLVAFDLDGTIADTTHDVSKPLSRQYLPMHQKYCQKMIL